MSQQNGSKIKLIVLGLDGATFDLLDKFKEDELPCLKGVIAHGVRASLESTFPPVTGPAWLACATGKNPGKTGVFDFLNRTVENSFEVKSITSAKFRQARSYWDYLSDVGKKVGIWNYPMLYPSYAINGFMIGGFGTSPYNDDFTYPRELKAKLLDLCGDYTIHFPYATPRYTNNPTLFINDMMKLLDQNETIVKFLIEQDIVHFVGIISATDFAQHYMWRYIDNTHPLYEENEARKYKIAFLQIWQRIDRILETVLTKVEGDDANLLIVSDHGFGPHKQSFYTNTWLESEGYLIRKGVRSLLATKLHSLALKTISKAARLNPRLSAALKQKKSISSFVRSIQKSNTFLNQVNLKKSVAFATYHATNSGKIYINMTSESPIKIRSDYEMIRDEIVEKLREVCNKLNMKVTIHLPDNIYSGEFSSLAPDILFEINDFECSVHYEFSKLIHKDIPHIPSHSGSHRRNGIFIAYGPDIKKNIEIQGAKIYDIAPTILHMFGLPVPDDIDGRVLKEIFKEGSEPAQRKVKYQQVDVKKVKDRIRKLKKSGKL